MSYHIKLHQMKALAALVEHGTVTRAAEILQVSQPAISRTIRQMEEDLSLQLFSTVNGRLVPTQHATSLLPGVIRILTQMDDLVRQAEGLREGRRGVLRIATAPSSLVAVVEAGHDELRRLAPEALLDVVAARTSSVLDMITTGSAEVGFCQLHGMETGIVSHSSFRGSVVCVLPSEHPLAHRDELSAQDLAGQPLITFPNAELTGRRVMMAFSRAGVMPNIGLHVSQTLQALNLVAVGRGLALVDSYFGKSLARASTATLPDNYRGLTVVPFNPTIQIDLHMITSASRPLSYLAEIYVDTLLSRYQVDPLQS